MCTRWRSNNIRSYFFSQQNSNALHHWMMKAWWSCFYFIFSCVMLILELPMRMRWKSSRQWIVSSLNCRQPYKKGLCDIKVPISYFMPYNYFSWHFFLLWFYNYNREKVSWIDAAIFLSYSCWSCIKLLTV